MDNLKIVITSFAEEEDAVEMANKLLENNLAACCNIFPGVKSFFRWENQLLNEVEILMLIKTREFAVKDVIRVLERDHPYDLPGIEVLSVEDASKDFQDWVNDETRNPKVL